MSTYGGHPASCAVALKNIEIIEEENIVSRVASLGESILGRLKDLIEHENVGEVRHKGFLYGIELVKDKESKEPAADEMLAKVIGLCKEKGLIIGRNGDTVPGFNNVLIVAPPLSSTENDLNFLVETVKYAFDQLN